jgi:hypothetical protein
MTATMNNQPMPEMLGRRDTELGAWVVDSCAPVRGLPHTNIVDKVMVVPVNDGETERCIRAHEMVHARVSPANDFSAWIQRGIASEIALRAVEESRVNFLAQKAGFDVLAHLSDGSELEAGVRIAKQGDWASAVYTAVGFSNSAGLKPFLTGIRRENREWGDALRDIAKKVEKLLAKADKRRTLASTAVDDRSGLAPLGFTHTEVIAEMVDRIANPPEPEVDEDENGEGQEGQSSNDGGGKPEADGEATQNKIGKADKQPAKPKVNKDKLKEINPASEGGRAVSWAELKVRKLPLTRHAQGGLGRKRRATDMGRNPRRIGRMLVDPERRIFDASKKGNGGVVIIDGSGSMRLSTADLVKIMEQAPGATVAVYSTDSQNKKDNLFILAEKGRMVDAVPERSGGNGVDGEALRWAIKQKQHRNAPVVFITDGLVHGINHGYEDFLAMDCIKQVRNERVIVRPNVGEGIKALEQLKAGVKPTMWYPHCWKQTWRRVQGGNL